jgi:AcrR family transcriptional regulator
VPQTAAKGRATREAIIATAEQLFAGHGIDGVSLRRIMTAAGTNPAAIHYHFGSKDELVRGILTHRMPALERRRRELLQERVEPDPSARTVLEALLLPLAELAEREEHRSYVGFLAALTFVSGSELVEFVNDELAPTGRELVARLIQVCPGIPPGLLLCRVRLALDTALRAISRPEQYAEADRTLAFDELLDVLVAAVTAPSLTGVSPARP